MTLATPSVYIGTRLMDALGVDDMPVLAGLKFDWGNDDQVDFDKPGTLSCRLLIRTPATTDFLTKGQPLGLKIGTTTVWAGRITQLTARPSKSKRDALEVSITAADTLADLEQYRVKVYWPADNADATTAPMRRAQIAGALPAGWTLENTNTAYDWTSARGQRWTAAPFLPIVDMHCRGTLGRRHVTSTYDPATGLMPRLTLTPERAKTSSADTLAAAGDGTWYMTTTAPANTGVVALGAGHVSRDVVWEKTPDDTITDVQLKSWGINYGNLEEDSSGDYDLWVNEYTGVDNAAMQAKYGFHQVEFDIDGLPNFSSPRVANIVNYWVDADAQWRPTGVEVPDSRKLPDATALAILDVAKRYKAYATVDGLPAYNPAGGSRVRAYIIAGDAEWTGKKWRFNLTFGRVPRPAGGALTFESIRSNTNPAISGATAETVGDTITFADFAYIGA